MGVRGEQGMKVREEGRKGEVKGREGKVKGREGDGGEGDRKGVGAGHEIERVERVDGERRV